MTEVRCPLCELPAYSCRNQVEGRMLATIHDGLHHGGHPTMRVRDLVECVACGGAAARVVVVAEAMAPVAACGACAEVLAGLARGAVAA